MKRCPGSIWRAQVGDCSAKPKPSILPHMTSAVRAAACDDITRELAGWYLLAADLRHAVAATRALQQQARQSVKDSTALRSLWISAHLAYARCFVDGPTVKIDASIFDGLSGGRAQAHRFLLLTASKHLAQPPNPLPFVRVDIEHDAEARPIGIKYIPSSTDAAAPDSHDIGSLAWLSMEALKHVEVIEARLVARLKDCLQANPATGSGP